MAGEEANAEEEEGKSGQEEEEKSARSEIGQCEGSAFALHSKSAERTGEKFA